MIARIAGKLIELETDAALIQVGDVCYEVLLPGYAVSALASSINDNVELWTYEYHEASPGGGNIIPRLVGFLTRNEKDFFHKYTSVKGMGIKKGLKSLTVPIATIAGAIESGDEKLLLSLPAVGKRFAQLIIAQLQGKLGDFALASPASADSAPLKDYQREALEILIAWGEKRNEIVELIEIATKKHPDVTSAQELVPLVYRIKQGVEV